MEAEKSNNQKSHWNMRLIEEMVEWFFLDKMKLDSFLGVGNNNSFFIPIFLGQQLFEHFTSIAFEFKIICMQCEISINWEEALRNINWVK